MRYPTLGLGQSDKCDELKNFFSADLNGALNVYVVQNFVGS
jgi:hypothetical protein